ncbi:hypothetical protein E2C01_014042 [Portunus trituberculatus]|uniref:Uncharacterized protein n=1 Tax=Portunus trituberculatus TaxID=210409 RepID=A0A5B7DJ31_PORTR|nr:hypothetical protein [Portunus trituberculatus]
MFHTNITSGQPACLSPGKRRGRADSDKITRRTLRDESLSPIKRRASALLCYDSLLAPCPWVARDAPPARHHHAGDHDDDLRLSPVKAREAWRCLHHHYHHHHHLLISSKSPSASALAKTYGTIPSVMAGEEAKTQDLRYSGLNKERDVSIGGGRGRGGVRGSGEVKRINCLENPASRLCGLGKLSQREEKEILIMGVRFTIP